jgi:5-hydroxyisourate hydrolase
MITTHVLDTSRGQPGREIAIELEHQSGDSQWTLVGAGKTDNDGRLRTLTSPGHVAAGTYRLRFHTAPYFAALAVESFFPLVEIHFTVADAVAHYHVPLLISPYGYSTYRGT